MDQVGSMVRVKFVDHKQLGVFSFKASKTFGVVNPLSPDRPLVDLTIQGQDVYISLRKPREGEIECAIQEANDYIKDSHFIASYEGMTERAILGSLEKLPGGLSAADAFIQTVIMNNDEPALVQAYGQEAVKSRHIKTAQEVMDGVIDLLPSKVIQPQIDYKQGRVSYVSVPAIVRIDDVTGFQPNGRPNLC